MMKTLALMALLLGAVVAPGRGAAGDAPGRSPPLAHARPRAVEDPPARRWTPALRASVQQGCEQALPQQGLCACLTRELEAHSRDPQVVTAEEIQAGLEHCRTM